MIACVGCIWPFARGPKPLTVQLTGDARQNLENDRPNAVVVRIYQLSGRGNFDRAPLSALWNDDARVLGDELLAKRELTVLPDGKEILKIELAGGTLFVGVVADFIKPEPDAWRRIYPIASVKKRQIAVRVGERQLSIKQGEYLRVQ